MKKLYFFLAFVHLFGFAHSQCFGTFEYPTPATVSHNYGTVQEIDDCNFAGDFATLTNLTVGEDYEFTINLAGGYLTLTDESNNVIASGTTPLIVPAITLSTVRLHMHTNAACGTDITCQVTTLQCTSCTPPTPPANDDCSAVTPTVLVNGAAATTFTGTTLGATASAEETAILEGAMVWEAVELTGACNDLTVDYCGTAAGIMYLTMVAFTDCLTTFTIGDYDFETCGDDNATIRYNGIPAGIYYLPVISDASSNTLGDYVMNVSSVDCPTTPDCASTPIFPADTATDIAAVTPITVTWTAPATGPAPTSYDVYAGDDPGNLQFFANVTETQMELNVGAYGLLVYWQVVPRNGSAAATGCPIWSFTTEAFVFEGFCVYAEFGQYPSAAYTPVTCDGTTSNNVTTVGYSGEFSLVNVTAGQTYQFNSSEPDLITISYDGITADAYGVASVTWTAPTDGSVRFYTHLNDNLCGSESVFRTRSVVCGASLGVGSFNIDNLKVYPNPVTSILNLSAQANIEQVTIYNMLGQEVLSASFDAMHVEVDMAALHAGAYFVKVTSNDSTGTIKVVKQ